MKNNQAFLIALAIIIGAGDRLIAAIESHKSPTVIVITGLVGAAIAVKFLLEQRPEKEAKNQQPSGEPPNVGNVIVGSVTNAAEQVIAETVTQTITDAVNPKKRTPNA